MVLFEIHRMFDSQVANTSGRRRTEMVMRVLVQRVVRGQVSDRSVHRRRPDVDVVLEELGQGPPRSTFNLNVRNFRRQVLEGLRHGIEELDIRERGVDEGGRWTRLAAGTGNPGSPTRHRSYDSW